MSFALFFLGEYANMILMSAMTTVLFLGGWLPPVDIAPFNMVPGPIWFIIKICLVLFVFCSCLGVVVAVVPICFVPQDLDDWRSSSVFLRCIQTESMGLDSSRGRGFRKGRASSLNAGGR